MSFVVKVVGFVDKICMGRRKGIKGIFEHVKVKMYGKENQILSSQISMWSQMGRQSCLNFIRFGLCCNMQGQ